MAAGEDVGGSFISTGATHDPDVPNNEESCASEASDPEDMAATKDVAPSSETTALPPVFSMPLFVFDDNHFSTTQHGMYDEETTLSDIDLEELEAALNGIDGIEMDSSTGSFESDVANHPTYISSCDGAAYIDFESMPTSSPIKEATEEGSEAEKVAASLVEEVIEEGSEAEKVAASLVKELIDASLLKVEEPVGDTDTDKEAEKLDNEEAEDSDEAITFSCEPDNVSNDGDVGSLPKPLDLEVDVVDMRGKNIQTATDEPKVKISIFDAICFPTKLVNGMVTMERDYDVASLTVSLLCEGSQTISWCVKSYSHGLEGKLIEKRDNVFETQTFFTDYADLIHRDLGDNKLNFAFSYQFPPNLPSSFNYTQTDGKEICGTIEYSFILLDITENEVIAKRSMNLYEAPPYHYIPLPRSDSVKVYYLTCINKGDVLLKAETDKGCYFFGDVAQVRCCITNNACEKVSSIGVTLCRYLHFKDAKFNESKLRHIVHHQQFKDVEGSSAARKSYETILNFEILGAETQSVSCSQLINCKYVLRVSIKIRCQADLYVDLDVILYKTNKIPEMKGSKLVLELKDPGSPITMSPTGSVSSRSSDSGSRKFLKSVSSKSSKSSISSKSLSSHSQVLPTATAHRIVSTTNDLFQSFDENSSSFEEDITELEESAAEQKKNAVVAPTDIVMIEEQL